MRTVGASAPSGINKATPYGKATLEALPHK